VGQVFKFSDERVRSLVACGAAGGIAATFNAPIAGALFAIEVILGRFHTLYFGAVVISAVVSDVIAQAFTDEVRAFDVPEYSLESPWEDLDRALDRSGTGGLRVADIATYDEILLAYPDESIGTALRRLGVRDVSRLPVVQRDSMRPIGVVRRNDVVRAYDHAISKRGQELQRAESLGLGQVEDLGLVQIHLRKGSPVAGRTVSRLGLPEDCLLVSLRRGSEQKVVRGSTVLAPGDVVTVVARKASVSEVRKLLGG